MPKLTSKLTGENGTKYAPGGKSILTLFQYFKWWCSLQFLESNDKTTFADKEKTDAPVSWGNQT